MTDEERLLIEALQRQRAALTVKIQMTRVVEAAQVALDAARRAAQPAEDAHQAAYDEFNRLAEATPGWLEIVNRCQKQEER